MVSQNSPSVFSGSYSYILPRLPPTANIYPTNYLNALTQFHRYFQQNVVAYFSDTSPEEKIKNYTQFQIDYQMNADKVIRTSTRVITNGKQFQLLQTLHKLFHYTFSNRARGASVSQPVEIPTPLINESFSVEKPSESEHLTTPPTLQLLPTEILMDILKLSITDWQAVGRWALTCRQFYVLATTPYILKILFEAHPRLFSSLFSPRLSHDMLASTGFHPAHLENLTDLTDADLKIIAAQGSHLQRLRFNGGRFTPEGLADLLQKCSHLQTLEFYQCQVNNFDDYVTVISLYAKALEHLKVINCKMSDQSLFALSFCSHHLRCFEYVNSLCEGSLTDYGLVPFFDRASHLESIKLIGCPHVTQASVISYIAAKLDPLKEIKKGNLLQQLTFSYCGLIDHKLFANLANFCPNLEKLELGFATSQCINHIRNKRVDLLRIAQNCSKLHSLKLNDCLYLSSSVLEEVLLARQTNLTELELLHSIPLTPTFFDKLATCRQLKSFKFKPLESSSLSQKNLEQLKTGCPTLETLSLIDCQLNEADLISYLQGSSLTQLQLLECGTFGSPLLTALSDSCPPLKVLEIESTKTDLTHPEPFNDHSIDALASACSSLNTLSLSAPPSSLPSWQLSDSSLKSLARSCPDLTHLHLSHVDLLRTSSNRVDPLLKYFTQRCLKLTHLGLPDNQMTEKQALSLILPYQHQLQSLNLENMQNLSSSFVQALTKCSQLKSLELGQTSLNFLLLKRLLTSLPHLNHLSFQKQPSSFNSSNSESNNRILPQIDS